MIEATMKTFSISIKTFVTHLIPVGERLITFVRNLMFCLIVFEIFITLPEIATNLV